MAYLINNYIQEKELCYLVKDKVKELELHLPMQNRCECFIKIPFNQTGYVVPQVVRAVGDVDIT